MSSFVYNFLELFFQTILNVKYEFHASITFHLRSGLKNGLFVFNLPKK